ncbi:MAG TPA: hypothetical protein VN133_00015 [Humibacter sp.]|nr:hypothetical protein [Humibacter sp.]
MSTMHVDGAPQQTGYQAAESKGLSVTSLVLGIVSIVAGWTFLVPVIGLVLGLVALRREPGSRTMSLWGIVLNTVVLAGSLIFALVAGVIGLVLLPIHLFW